MSFPLNNDAIASALRLSTADIPHLNQNWPLIETCLDALGIASFSSLIGALATIRVECPTFAPRHEKYNGTPEVYFARYDNRTDLGNTHPGDGMRFAGRGFIQITGRSNYEYYGNKVGVNLVADPDKALDPNVAASIFAAYWFYKGVYKAADAGAWSHCRKLVNGGYNSLEDFMRYVNALHAEVGKCNPTP